MHAVLYRWRVKPGTTEQFRDAWRRREAAFERGVLQVHPAVAEMLACVDEALDEIHLTVTDDLLLPRPSSEAHV